MSFDTPIERRGTHCIKWDGMEQIYGVPADTGISMWVADMDFATAPVVTNAVKAMVDHGVYGLFRRRKQIPRCHPVVDERAPWLGP